MATPTQQLLTAANYGILAAAGITNTGATIVAGGVIGSFPTTSITFDGGSAIVDNNDAPQAHVDALAAYNTFSAMPFTSLSGSSANLSVLGNGATASTYNAGNYSAGSSMDIPTRITLDAQGNPNAVFIFKAGSTTTLESGSSVILANGAKAANVIWLVGSTFTSVATSHMVGTILANTSITLGGGDLNGRALAGVVTSSGAVTISAANSITVPSSGPTPGPHSISGQIDFGTAGEIVYIRAVNVCLEGPKPIPFSTVIAADTTYSFTGLPDGQYILYTAGNPRAKILVTLLGNNVTDVNFPV